MNGDAVLHEILARGGGFGHRQHVELAWRYLEDHGAEVASVLLADAIRRVAAAHGALDKFHATITGAWVQCVAVHRQRWPAQTFGEFIERNGALLDSTLLECHFSRNLLFSHQARVTLVEPDIRPLPVLPAA